MKCAGIVLALRKAPQDCLPIQNQGQKKATTFNRFQTRVIALIVVLLVGSFVVAFSLHFLKDIASANPQPTTTPFFQTLSPATSTSHPTFSIPTATTTASQPTTTPTDSPFSPTPTSASLFSPLSGTETSSLLLPSGIEWNKTYSVYTGSSESGFYTVTQTKDGDYLLLGSVSSLIPADNYPLIAKTDSDGNMKWSAAILNMGLTMETATADGGYILTGNNCMVKIDSLGDIQWNKTYSEETISSVIQTSDEGYAFLSFGDNDTGTLIKTDKSGNLQWSHQYDFIALFIIQTNDGEYAIASGNLLVKTDSSGKMMWNRTISSGTLMCLIQTNDGGYALAGYTIEAGNTVSPWIAKIDADGNILWNHTYSEFGVGQALSIIQTNDDGYAFVNRPAGVLVKTDSSGHLQWNITNGQIAQAYSVIQTSDGGYVFQGIYPDMSLNAWLIKIVPDP